MPRSLLALIGLLLLLAPSTARAGCPVQYSLSKLAQDLGLMQSALRNLDETSFEEGGRRLSIGLRCMGNPAPVPVYATAYRMLGAWHHLGGRPEEATQWFMTAHELDPTFDWDINDFGPGHPIRVLYDEVKATAPLDPVAVEGQELVTPAGSKILLDGRSLSQAAATMDRPHVLQQVCTDNAIRKSWIITGNAFPQGLTRAAGADGEGTMFAEGPVQEGKKEKRSKKSKKSSDQVVAIDLPQDDVLVVERFRPPLKTPLLLAGGAGLLAAGGTYALSFSARKDFGNTTTTDEAEAARATTNTLVLATGGIVMASVGLGYVGVLLDGGFGLGFIQQF